MNPAELRMMWMSTQYNSERISLEDAATLLGHPSLTVMEDMTHQPTLVSSIQLNSFILTKLHPPHFPDLLLANLSTKQTQILKIDLVIIIRKCIFIKGVYQTLS